MVERAVVLDLFLQDVEVFIALIRAHSGTNVLGTAPACRAGAGQAEHFVIAGVFERVVDVTPVPVVGVDRAFAAENLRVIVVDQPGFQRGVIVKGVGGFAAHPG